MATRGTIAIELADGTVKQIYSHWDNYLFYNGQMLQDHYTDPAKVEALIDGGAISSLAPSIEQPKATASKKQSKAIQCFMHAIVARNCTLTSSVILKLTT